MLYGKGDAQLCTIWIAYFFCLREDCRDSRHITSLLHMHFFLEEDSIAVLR
jgi:hypothetical protein